MADWIRPQKAGFASLLRALPQLGFKKKEPGFYWFGTPYYSSLEVYGDRQQGGVPSEMSEYLLIKTGPRLNRLDEYTRQAIHRIMETDHPGEKKRIRDGFIPKKEFNNGPEIDIEGDVINFGWWTGQPQAAFSIIDHLISKPPQYIGGDLDGGDETPEKDQPTPGGFKDWLRTKTLAPVS